MQSRPRMTTRQLLRRMGGIALLAGVLALAVGWLFAAPRVQLVGCVAALVGAVWWVLACFSNDDPVRAVYWRYLRRFFPAIVAYVLVLLVALPLARNAGNAWLRGLLALAPVLPVMGVFWAMYRLLAGSDELEQRQQLEAVALAAAGIAVLSFGAGLLDGVGLLPPGTWLVWVAPVMFMLYGAALAWIRRRYRDDA